MVRVRELWPEYQNSKYQAAIDMLDSVSFGVLTILASEASTRFSENVFEAAVLGQQ